MVKITCLRTWATNMGNALNYVMYRVTYHFLRFINLSFRAGLRWILGREKRDILLRKMKYLNPLRVFVGRFRVTSLYNIHWGKYLTTVDRPVYREPEVYKWINLEKGDIAIDVGAHHGWYTLIFSKKVGKTGWVVAVEPHPRNLQFLHKNIITNKLTNVQVLPCALSDKSGVVELFIGKHSGLHTIMHNTMIGSILVKAQPLDAILSQFDKVKLVKIDVEGAELLILRPCKFLYKVKRFIVEVHTQRNMQTLIDLFKEKKFQPQIINRYRLVATRIPKMNSMIFQNRNHNLGLKDAFSM